MITGLPFPWKSSVVIQSPWMLPAAIVGVAFVLSLITWFRTKKK